MGRRCADCRASHLILIFLAGFLAVTAIPAGRQDIAVRRPLPDIKQLLSEVQENQKQIESLVDQYSCREK